MTHTTNTSPKQSLSGPRYQRGHAPFAESIFKLILVVILAFVAVTVAIPAVFAVKRGSLAMGLVAVAIAVLWLYLFVTKIALPSSKDQAFNKWAAGAVEACSQELAALPEQVPGTSLLDETAGLSKEQVIQLLSERGLEFVEVKPFVEAGKAPRIALSGEGGQGDGSWRLPGLAAPYVRLRLSTTSDPLCNPSLDRHGTLKMPPFMPDTCIAVDAVEQPTAELAIVLEPASAAELGPYGTRKIVRRRSQEVLARLTTCETAGQTFYGAGDRLTRLGEDPKHRSCRSPHRILADLLFSPDADWLDRSDRVLKVRKVKVSKSPEELLMTIEQLPLVQAARESHAFLTELEDWTVFSRTIRAEEWAGTVEAAREASSQTAPYGPHLLDLGSRTLIQLNHGWPYPWKAHAALDGFFLVNDNLGWDTAPRNLLVRVRADGEFEWAVSIAPPQVQSIAAMRWPQALYVEGSTLIFADRGRKVTPEDSPPSGAKTRSTRWEVSLPSLPPMAPLARSR